MEAPPLVVERLLLDAEPLLPPVEGDLGLQIGQESGERAQRVRRKLHLLAEQPKNDGKFGSTPDRAR